MTRPREELQAVQTLEEMLALHDEQFVRCAYLTLFGRAADPQGLQYYTGRLRAGHSQLGVLRQLSKSAETRARGAGPAGLKAALDRYRRGQWPVIGIVFRWLESTEGNSRAEREVRALRNQLYLLGEMVLRQAELMETRCEVIDESVQRLRHESQSQFTDMRAALSTLGRLGEDAARQHGALQRDSKLRLDEARESLAELGQRVEAGQRRFDETEQALADLQDALRRGVPLPTPLDPLALKKQRQLTPGARTVYARLRKAFAQGVR